MTGKTRRGEWVAMPLPHLFSGTSTTEFGRWQSFIPQSYGATPNFSKIHIRHLVGFTFKKGTKVAWQLTHVDSHVIGPGLGAPICQP